MFGLVTTDTAAYAEHQYPDDQQQCKQTNTQTNCQLEPARLTDNRQNVLSNKINMTQHFCPMGFFKCKTDKMQDK